MPTTYTDITGQIFQSIKVTSYFGKERGKGGKRGPRDFHLWNCLCLLCGKEFVLRGQTLKIQESCGCALQAYRDNGANTTHGLTGKTKLYSVWGSMKERCYSPKCKGYKDYGGNGIEVCEDWRQDFKVFYEWAIENGYKENSGLSIERLDPTGNYCPENCTWIPKNRQSLNQKRTHWVEIDGERMPVYTALAKGHGKVRNYALSHRLRHGWDPLDALLTPPWHPPISGKNYGFTDGQLRAQKRTRNS